MKKMKIAAWIILIIAIVLTGYGYWGAFTSPGNKVYDEMDAFFPFFLMLTGIVLFFIFLLLVILIRRKAKKGYRANKDH